MGGGVKPGAIPLAPSFLPLHFSLPGNHYLRCDGQSWGTLVPAENRKPSYPALSQGEVGGAVEAGQGGHSEQTGVRAGIYFLLQHSRGTGSGEPIYRGPVASTMTFLNCKYDWDSASRVTLSYA